MRIAAAIGMLLVLAASALAQQPGSRLATPPPAERAMSKEEVMQAALAESLRRTEAMRRSIGRVPKGMLYSEMQELLGTGRYYSTVWRETYRVPPRVAPPGDQRCAGRTLERVYGDDAAMLFCERFFALDSKAQTDAIVHMYSHTMAGTNYCKTIVYLAWLAHTETGRYRHDDAGWRQYKCTNSPRDYELPPH